MLHAVKIKAHAYYCNKHVWKIALINTFLLTEGHNRLDYYGLAYPRALDLKAYPEASDKTSVAKLCNCTPDLASLDKTVLFISGIHFRLVLQICRNSSPVSRLEGILKSWSPFPMLQLLSLLFWNFRHSYTELRDCRSVYGAVHKCHGRFSFMVEDLVVSH